MQVSASPPNEAPQITSVCSGRKSGLLLLNKGEKKMRIRRKKHLEERLNNASDILLVPKRDILNVNLAIEQKEYYDFAKIFGSDNPLCLEIGCGKGGFISRVAKENPTENYIAVEMLENIVVMACELCKAQGLTNVRFINTGAEYLPRYIKDNLISKIYLNFSPPFPKKGSERKRLTSDDFVRAYKNFLLPGGKIFQKTDDREFFEYSFNKFIEHGFMVEDVSNKIATGQIYNVETEYEIMFKKLNIKAQGLIATKP